MSYSDFLDHTCDIYHMAQGQNKPLGFGLIGEPSFDYPNNPDILNVACHFNSPSPSMNQNDPKNDLLIRTKLNLPLDTDLRLLDKVIWKEEGLEYTVISPKRSVISQATGEGHDYVYVERKGVQQPL